MLDDFFSRALIAGVGVALVAGPLGCYIVWRRLAYFGDTLSHAALLGVALALLFQVNITLSVFSVSVFVSLALVLLQRRITLSADALLGLLAHSALAVGMVALSFMSWVRVDLMGFLFGDILAVTPRYCRHLGWGIICSSHLGDFLAILVCSNGKSRACPGRRHETRTGKYYLHDVDGRSDCDFHEDRWGFADHFHAYFPCGHCSTICKRS